VASAELDLAEVFEASGTGLDDSILERVLHIAGDRPATETLPALADPTADHDDAQSDPDGRRADVEEKHRRVIDFLDEYGYDAVILGRADSIAWFTAGGDLARETTCERGCVLLFINRKSRAVLTDNVQSARVFEEEVAGLGFQLKERPWYDAPERMVAELAHNRRVASDIVLPGCTQEFLRLRPLRLKLTKLERQRLRELGRTVTKAVEATCRNFRPGENEADVAGHLAHRLVRDGVLPVDLRVAGDDRLARFRQPTFKAAPILRRATIAVVGRRYGLCAGVTRTVSLGPIDPAFRQAHTVATMVDASCIFFSRPNEPVREVFRRAKRIYEKFGHPDEWTLDYQGCLTGYTSCEGQLLPDTELALQSDMALRWSPSVASARSEDTVVVDTRGYEVVTEAQNWPKVEVVVKGYPVIRPGILERKNVS
jgi:Xaa-Pro aminopeptidase